jgi:hypothetical protein
VAALTRRPALSTTKERPMGYESIPTSPGSLFPGGNGDGAERTDPGKETSEGGAPAGTPADLAVDVVLIDNDAANDVYAKDLHMHNSAAMTADVLGDMYLDKSAVAAADIAGNAHLRDSSASIVNAEGSVELTGGWAGVVVAKEFTVRDGGTVLMTDREAAVAGAVIGALVVAAIAAVAWLLKGD